MANLPTDDSGTRGSLLRARVPLFNLVGRADDALYGVERVVVVSALMIMTLSSFLKVLADFFEKRQDMTLSYILTFIAFFIIGRVSAGSSKVLQDNRLMSNVSAVLWGLLGLFYIWMVYSSTQTIETLELYSGGAIKPYSANWLVGKISSATVTNMHVLVIGLMVLHYDFARPRPIDEPTLTVAAILRFLVIVAATAGGLWIGSKLSTGYSWAPQISLVLLLWMAFLGASMATHEGKHLAVDAIRKIVPPHRTRAFNAASLALAGVVTAAFLYLATSYVLKRFGEDPEPGKIPDWIKVLSIPVSLAIMTLRFFGYSLAELVGAIMKIEPEPAPEITEVA